MATQCGKAEKPQTEELSVPVDNDFIYTQQYFGPLPTKPCATLPKMSALNCNHTVVPLYLNLLGQPFKHIGIIGAAGKVSPGNVPP